MKFGLIVDSSNSVIDGDPVTAVGNQAGFPQSGQMSRDPRLCQPSCLSKFGNREFLSLQEGEEAQAGGVGKQGAVPVDQLKIDELILLSRLSDIVYPMGFEARSTPQK
jgi:hypothetical protein